MEKKDVSGYTKLDKDHREEYIRERLDYGKDKELTAIYTHSDGLEKSTGGAYFFNELVNRHTKKEFPKGEDVLDNLSKTGQKRHLEIFLDKDYEDFSFQNNSQYLVNFTLSDRTEFFRNGRLLNYESLKHIKPDKFTTLLSEMKYELENMGYYYSESTIRRMLLSIMTGELTLLVGPSGTGKTSLVSSLAKLFDAECEIISVQPNWQDKQDLLGFYNPMRREYFATSFVDTLIEANKKENREKLYFICLDEINLAKVEYYFAELLSTLELEEPEIRLYSDSEYEKNEERAEVIKKLVNKPSDALKWIDLKQQVENNKRYPSRLPIPDNVRFFGTMNMDGLIEPLSSKVIDRSIIIPLEGEAETIYQEKRAKDYIPFDLNASEFKVAESQQINPADLNALNNKLLSLLDQLNLPYHYRFKKQVENYFRAGISHGLKKDELLDDIVLTKVLPRIHRHEESIYEIDWEKEHYKQLINSKEKFEQMEKNVEHSSLFSYWVN